MNKIVYQTLFQQYATLKAQQERNDQLYKQGHLTSQHYSLLSIHTACQMGHIENELDVLETALPTPVSSSIWQRLSAWI